jgi:hypothetical protein
MFGVIMNFTVKGFANLNDVKVNREQALKLGRCASKLCRQGGITPGRTRDETFGEINNYPESILEAVFKEASLLN